MPEAKSIRVCHVASGDLWAGAEVQIATLLRALKADPALELSVIVLNRGRLEEELGAAGIPVTVYAESETSVWRILTRLVTHFNQWRPDVVHSHRYKEHILSIVAAKLSHNPLVVQTCHGLEEHLRGWAALKMSAYMGLNTIAGNMAVQGVIGVSEEIAVILKQRYPRSQVRCIRNGVDLTRVKAHQSSVTVRTQLRIPQDTFVIGTVGRLTPVKGIEYAIQAFAKRCDTQSRALLIIGDGPLRVTLQDVVGKAGVEDKTLFLGTRTDVYDLMAACDLLVLPSLHEGIPMVLLEAMALGVPIIASRVGGIPEILDDGQEAWLVPAKDIDALSSAIDAMAMDSVLRSKLAHAARARVEAQFSIAKTAEVTRDFYRALIRQVSVPA